MKSVNLRFVGSGTPTGPVDDAGRAPSIHQIRTGEQVHGAGGMHEFAEAVRRDLGESGQQKWPPAAYLYDDLGSALFEAITLLPEYPLARGGS